MRTLIWTVVFVFIAALQATPSTAQYPPGFVWNRFADWSGGQSSGSTLGNPDDDSAGNPVWQYEYVDGGGGLGSQNPWYLEPPARMEWRQVWFVIYGPVWARGDDAPPAIWDAGLGFPARPLWYRWAPMVRWKNPASDPMVVSVAGSLTARWESVSGNQAESIDLEIVLGLTEAGGSTSVLFETTVAKPTADATHESVVVPISLAPLPIAVGDELFLSFRAVGESTEEARFNLSDEFSITHIRSVPGLGPYGVALLSAFLISIALLRLRRAAFMT